MRFLIYLISFMTFSFSVVAKENITPEGFFGQWRVYTAKEGSETICFMVASPQHTTVDRENNFLTLTHRPYENSFDVVSVMFGATYHKKSRPTIEVDNLKPIEMKTSDDASFVMSEKDTTNLILDMIKGNVARTKGRSDKNTLLRETYSLKGFSKAYALLNEKCPRSTETVTEEVSQTPEVIQGEIKQ